MQGTRPCAGDMHVIDSVAVVALGIRSGFDWFRLVSGSSPDALGCTLAPCHPQRTSRGIRLDCLGSRLEALHAENVTFLSDQSPSGRGFAREPGTHP